MKNLESNFISIANKEVHNPTFPFTLQFLSVHEIQFESNLPKVKDLIVSGDNKTASVYYCVKDEEFFFHVLININAQSDMYIKWVNVAPYHSCIFRAISDILTIDKIVSRLNILKPTEIWANNCDPTKQNTKYRNDGFEIELDQSALPFEDKLLALLEYLEQDKESLNSLVEDCTLYIKVLSTFYNEPLPGGYFLDSLIIEKLNSLNIKIDFVLYISGRSIE